MYSHTNEAIFISLSVRPTFYLLKMNSTSGEYLQFLKGGTIYQYHTIHTCSLSNDESTIFWNGYANFLETGLALARFDISSSVIDIAYYNNYIAGNIDLVAISNNEVFFHASQSDKFHHIKVNFSANSNIILEQFHKSMSGQEEIDFIRATYDQDSETIWNVLEYRGFNLIYSQHNISDFAIIGNRYVNNYAGFYNNIHNVEVGDGVVYFTASNFLTRDELFKINATTQEMIIAFQIGSDSLK